MTTVQSLTAPAKEWIAALTRLTPAMAGKKPAPILNNIVINPRLSTVAGTNYETSAITDLLDSEGRGEPFLVPWRWLLDAVRATSGRTKSAAAMVSLEGKKVTVSACGYELHTETADIAEYPEIPDVLPDVEVAVPAAELRAAFRRASVAASLDDTLPILTTLRVEITDGDIALLATDRYRLSADHATGEGKGETDFLLSRKTLKSIDRFLVGESVEFGFQKEQRRILIGTATTTYTTLAIDGDYPKIRSLFPDDVTGSFEVDRTVFLESARVALTMNDRYQASIIELSDEGAKVTFDYGVFGPSVSPTAAGWHVAGEKEPIRFAMNPKYLIDTLTQISTDKVRISYTQLPKPFLFTAEGVAASDEKVLKHLIMPVRMPS
jgi:DNA polymerase-3 subunit beta